MASASVQNAIYKTKFNFLATFTGTFKNPPKNPVEKPGFTLVFNEEFASPIDWSKWDYKEHWGNYSPGSTVIFKKSQVTQNQGEAVLTTNSQTVPGEPGAVSGKLTTYKFLNQKYGYFEIRAKVPAKGVTNWPAFWLASTEKWPPEIDVFELMNEDSSSFTCTLHWYDDNVNAAAIRTVFNQINSTYGYMPTGVDDAIRFLKIGWTQAKQDLIDKLLKLRINKSEGSKFKLPGTDTLSYKYHTFGLLWEEGRITWLFDNVEVYCATVNVPNIPMYAIINNSYSKPIVHVNDVPSKLMVDYFRVYKKK
jgi:beta-glucanase (GH16 family)